MAATGSRQEQEPVTITAHDVMELVMSRRGKRSDQIVGSQKVTELIRAETAAEKSSNLKELRSLQNFIAHALAN